MYSLNSRAGKSKYNKLKCLKEKEKEKEEKERKEKKNRIYLESTVKKDMLKQKQL